jgi:hypothetical protein
MIGQRSAPDHSEPVTIDSTVWITCSKTFFDADTALPRVSVTFNEQYTPILQIVLVIPVVS